MIAMRKFILGAAPLLAVAAFAIVPAAASAVTTYGTCAGTGTSSNCPSGQKFTAFTAVTKVISYNPAGTTFKLENEAKTAGIECGYLSDRGTVENVAGVGKSTLKLVFAECKGSGELAACEINPPSNVITGNVTDEVKTATTVEIKITSGGFNVKCGATELGDVTGSATGTQAARTNRLKFTAASGLAFLGAPATITGEDELYTEVAGKPDLAVFI
jgi:hypothetical protein